MKNRFKIFRFSTTFICSVVIMFRINYLLHSNGLRGNRNYGKIQTRCLIDSSFVCLPYRPSSRGLTLIHSNSLICAFVIFRELPIHSVTTKESYSFSDLRKFVSSLYETEFTTFLKSQDLILIFNPQKWVEPSSCGPSSNNIISTRRYLPLCPIPPSFSVPLLVSLSSR